MYASMKKYFLNVKKRYREFISYKRYRAEVIYYKLMAQDTLIEVTDLTNKEAGLFVDMLVNKFYLKEENLQYTISFLLLKTIQHPLTIRDMLMYMENSKEEEAELGFISYISDVISKFEEGELVSETYSNCS